MKKFIGDKKFYRMLFAIMMPIVLQQFITQFVGLIDNLMVGVVGNDEMIGVSLANQILFVFFLAVFGSLSGASIFATQYFGAQDKKGYHEAFRFKLLIEFFIIAISLFVIGFFAKDLIGAFISSQEEDISNPTIVLESGTNYLYISLIGIIPFVIKEIYATSLREMKETMFPMISGLVAIGVNLILNYLLIFGKFGLPELGIIGAAIATVISRFVELFMVVIYAHVKQEKFIFLKGAYRKLLPKFSSIKKFISQTLLLTTNEFMWSLGLTLIVRCYSTKGLDVVGALNICNTVNNVFLTVGQSLGNATAIIIGNLLGASLLTEAKETSYKVLFSSFIIGIFVGLLMISISTLVPSIYNTSEAIKSLATDLIIISAICIPLYAFNCVTYFILRSGGKIIYTLLFDSIFVWVVKLSLAFILTSFTSFNFLLIYIFVYGIDIIKAFPGYILVDKGIWLKKIIEN